MDRTLVENAITKFYQRRLTNELAPCLECFADNVKFRLAGAENQSSFSAAASVASVASVGAFLLPKDPGFHYVSSGLRLLKTAGE